MFTVLPTAVSFDAAEFVFGMCTSEQATTILQVGLQTIRAGKMVDAHPYTNVRALRTALRRFRKRSIVEPGLRRLAICPGLNGAVSRPPAPPVFAPGRQP
jgi:hypothetical protein